MELLQELQKTFTYYLKDICRLWESWISAPSLPLGVSAFKIEGSQARHAWAFILKLTNIAINESLQEANDTVFFLRAFIQSWRVHANDKELNECILNGAGMYLQHYSKLVAEKSSKESDGKRVKTLEVAVKTGLSLLNQFLDEELKMHQELVRMGQSNIRNEGHIFFVSFDTLNKVLKKTIQMMQPSMHKNKENRKYNTKFFKHAAEATGQLLQCMRNVSDALLTGTAAHSAGALGSAGSISDMEYKVLEHAIFRSFASSLSMIARVTLALSLSRLHSLTHSLCLSVVSLSRSLSRACALLNTHISARACQEYCT